MAVVQYTAIVNQIRGKLNGSVFNKARNAYTLQRKQQGKRSETEGQLKRRAAFSSIQRTWKELTTAQRASSAQAASLNPVRDRFGNETVLSGYNHFVKSNLIRLLANVGISRDLAPISAPPFSMSFESSITDFATDTNGTVLIDTGAVLVTSELNQLFLTLICYISFPISKGVTNYSGRWFFVGSKTYATGTAPVPEIDVSFVTQKGLNYPIPEPQQKVLIRIDAWYPGIAAMVQRIEMETQF